MLKNYFIVTWRSLTRHKLYSAINIIGLATGMAACIVILLFAFYENSFDSMHHRNLYRLNDVSHFVNTGTTEKSANTAFQLGPTLKGEFPEVLNYSRVDGKDQYEMTYEEKRVFFSQTFFVDPSFLRMFDFPLLRGDRQTALQKPNSIVLTQSAAVKLFGNADPIGKTVSHFGEDTLLFTVTGILRDVPGNSQLQFEALESLTTLYKPDWMKGKGDAVTTYVELPPNTDRAALEKKFATYLKKDAGKDEASTHELFLLSLKDIHANAVDISDENVNFQKFDKRYTYILIVIGLLVLLIASINFMNLSTARSVERGKEVGIRKSIGASRPQLGIQFLGESVLFSLIALVIALGLVTMVLPYIDKLSGRDLSPLLSAHPGLLLSVFIGTMLLGVLSGLYPAIYLSSFQPVKVLKGGGDTGKSKSTFRNILVIGQFSGAIFLVIATIFVFRQLNYMETQDPGFDRDQIITVHLHGITARKFSSMKQELLTKPLVTGVTGAFTQLGGPLVTLGIGFWPGNGPMRVLFTPCLWVDPSYPTVYKIPLLAGRTFSNEKSANGNEFVINEMLARELLKDRPGTPLSSLIGKHFGGDTLGSVVGICKDFNFNSLHYKIQPMFMMVQTGGMWGTMSVKISGRQASRAIAFIQSTWKEVFPEYPFNYEFLDDHFKELYRTDTQVSQMVAIMAGLAILISCLGLFGLASFSAEKRTKEIGIRKVLGASVEDIVFLLSKHFIGLVLIANIIAWPLAWLALHRWIQDYAYRVAISWWVFVLAGTVALLIALGTVSSLAIKAARNNPIRSLRTD
ncbi:MAG TPA: ABC transporter permease [Puia sp.]|jgi:putative ABC transport system permease protein